MLSKSTRKRKISFCDHTDRLIIQPASQIRQIRGVSVRYIQTRSRPIDQRPVSVAVGSLTADHQLQPRKLLTPQPIDLRLPLLETFLSSADRILIIKGGSFDDVGELRIILGNRFHMNKRTMHVGQKRSKPKETKKKQRNPI